MNTIFRYKNINSYINVSQETCVAHNFGQGWFLNNKKLFAVDIPKNASTSGRVFYQGNNFVQSNFCNKDIDPEKFIVILRDPVKRWVSGLVEYIVGKHNLGFQNAQKYFDNKLITAIIFDQIVFDQHTLPQSKYLQGLNIEKIDFYYHDDDDVYGKIAFYNNFDYIITNENNTIKNNNKIFLYNHIMKELKDKKNLKTVESVYYCDYQLFDEIQFM